MRISDVLLTFRSQFVTNVKKDLTKENKYDILHVCDSLERYIDKLIVKI